MEFKDLSWLEGEEIELVRGKEVVTDGVDGTRLPDRCVFLKDYPHTVLLDLVYIYDEFGIPRKPRHLKYASPKSALYTGDTLIKHNGSYLFGNEVIKGGAMA